MIRIVLPVIMLGVLVSPAAGKVYKCTDADGVVQYSGTPCGDGAQVMKGYSGAGGSRSVSKPSSGDPAGFPHLRLADGNIQPFVKILSLTVGDETRWPATSKEGLYVFHNGVKRLIEFDKLVSMTVLNYDRKYCGNTGYLCQPTVEVKTKEKTFTTKYKALHNIKVVINDDLGGGQQELTVWFGKARKRGKENAIRIRGVQFIPAS